MGIMLCELFDYVGGVCVGYWLKFWILGGLLILLFIDEYLDVLLDYEGVGVVGLMLGIKVLEIFDEIICVVCVVCCWIEFYKYELCGKCMLCWEGIFWLDKIYEWLEIGWGSYEDIDKLLDIFDFILGKLFCVLGDGVVSLVMLLIKYFCDEYLVYVEGGGCLFDF